MMDGWRHSGFNAHCGPRIHPRERKSREHLAAYLIRSSFSQRRIGYPPEEAGVADLSEMWVCRDFRFHLARRGYMRYGIIDPHETKNPGDAMTKRFGIKMPEEDQTCANQANWTRRFTSSSNG